MLGNLFSILLLQIFPCFLIFQNYKLIVAFCAYLTLISLQLAESKPLQAPNVTRTSNQQGTSKNNTVIKSFAVSNNGAFSPVTAILGRHATAHNTIKKKVEDKKRAEKIRVMKLTQKTLPTICVMSSTPEPENEEYANASGQIRSNSLFTSSNWGNSK
jgi:hypothetical protein